MAKPLSVDLRKRAVEVYLNGGGSLAEVGKRFCIHPVTLCKYVKQFRETGSLEPKAHSGGKIHQKIFDKHAEAIRSWLEEDQCRTNPELADLLKTHFEVQIDPSQISLILKKYDITRKKKSSTTRKSTPQKSKQNESSGGEP